MLGTTGPRATRRFSRGERGLLAAALTPLCDALEADVSLVRPSTPPGDVWRLALQASGRTVTGRLILEVPDEWLDVSAWAAVGVLDIAETSVPARDLIALSEGDIVVFDDSRAVDGALDVRWQARLEVLGHVAPVSVAGDGTAHVDGAFSSIVTAPARVSVDADTPVIVAAELATTPLRGGQILTLVPDATLGVAPRSMTVALRVGGERLADGELTDVGGELGVRVVAIRRPWPFVGLATRR